MDETAIQIAGVILTAASAAAGVAIIMARLVDRWLKERFDSMERRIDSMHSDNRRDIEAWQRVERDLLELRAELPLHYVRREEILRIEKKLDALLDRG